MFGCGRGQRGWEIRLQAVAIGAGGPGFWSDWRGVRASGTGLVVRLESLRRVAVAGRRASAAGCLLAI